MNFTKTTVMIWKDVTKKPDYSTQIAEYVLQGKTDGVATILEGPFGDNSKEIRRNWIDMASAQDMIAMIRNDLEAKGLSDLLSSATIIDYSSTVPGIISN